MMVGPRSLKPLLSIPSALRTTLCLLVLAAIAFANFVLNREEPAMPFWDENYYITSAQRYLDGWAQFAAHPPLGLMLIASGEALVKSNTGIDTTFVGKERHINGEELPWNYSFRGVRLLPSLFGAGGALLFFGLMLTITGRRDLALVFSSLYLLENAFIVHFAAAHLDGFQMFFFLAALWFLIAAVRRDRRRDNLLDAGFGLSTGLATMVKANSVLMLAMGGWLLLRRARRHRDWRPWPVLLELLRGGLWMGVPFLLAIVGVFAVHTALIKHPPDPATEGGRKDLSFTSPSVIAYASGKRHLDTEVLFDMMMDYQHYMAKDLQGVPKGTRDDSIPLLWPVHDRTINYRWDSDDGLTRYVQLAGNPVSWLLGLGALILALALALGRRVLGLEERGSQDATAGEGGDYALTEVLLLFYLLFMAAHIWLGTQRIMYLYHYFLPLVVTYILVPLMWRHLCRVHDFSPSTRRMALGLGAAMLFGAYAFVLPLSNHWPLTHEQCEWRDIIFQGIPCQ